MADAIKIKVNIQRTEVFAVPEKKPLITDKRTGAKTIFFPFKFNSGINGGLIITRLSKTDWQPSDDIESITIKFK